MHERLEAAKARREELIRQEFIDQDPANFTPEVMILRESFYQRVIENVKSFPTKHSSYTGALVFGGVATIIGSRAEVVLAEAIFGFITGFWIGRRAEQPKG